MNTYTSILEITPAIAATMKKAQVRQVAGEEIDAIDNRFEAEGKSVGLGRTAKNAVATEVKGMAATVLNVLIPFAAPGHFMMGRKKTAITQIILCCLSLLFPLCTSAGPNIGLGEVIIGLVLCYIVGFVYNIIMWFLSKLIDLKNSAKTLLNITNPYIQWKSITYPEQFSAQQYYDEYLALLNEREAHYKQIIKLCK